MCTYLHLLASFGSSVQITVTFCFELKFLRVQPCWSWSTLCQWRTGQKVLTLYTFCQWRAESPGTPYTFASEGQKVLAHFILLPVKVRKSWHTLYFCQWRSESPGTLYTFASPNTPYTFATHSGCVNTPFKATDTSDSDTDSWAQNGSAPIWPHSCFHNYQTSIFNKKDEKQSWPSHTGRLEW